MTVSTTRPNATEFNDGAAIFGGAASLQAAVSDDTDTTGVEIDNNEDIRFGFAEPSIPAGAIVKSLTLRARHRRAGGLISLSYILYPRYGTDPNAKKSAQYSLPSTHSTVPVVTYENPGDITDLQVWIQEWGHGTFNDARVYELWADTVLVEQPTVTSVVVGDGTSPITEDTDPIISWDSSFDIDGGAQTHYEVKVFTDDQYGAGGFSPDTTETPRSTGIVKSDATNVHLSEPFTDETYRAYVRVAQTVNGELHWSPWATDDFVIDVNKPGVPTLTIVAQSTKDRIRVTVQETAGDADTDWFELQRTADGGLNWENVRTPAGSGLLDNTGGGATVYDYEAPNGVEVTYRARAVHNYDPGHAHSEWAEGIGIWSNEYWHLKHPTKPALNMRVTLRSQPSQVRSARRGVFDIPNRKYPVVVSDSYRSESGDIAFRFKTDGDRYAFNAILDELDPLLLQAPPGNNWRDRWLSFGDHNRERATDWSKMATSFDGLPWDEVERPDNEVISGEAIEVGEVDPDIDIDTFTASAQGTGNLVWNHVPSPGESPAAVVVSVIQTDNDTGADEVSGVTYGGVAMTRFAIAQRLTGEAGVIHMFLLGANVPNGTQEIVVTVSAATPKRAACWSLSANGDVAVDDVDSLVSGSQANPSLTLEVEADEAVVLAAGFSGRTSTTEIDPGADYTADLEHDFGVDVCLWMHRTSDPTTGNVVADMIIPTADDVVFVAAALRVGAESPSVVLQEDLVTDPSPIALWKKIETAHPQQDITNPQHEYLTADPDPHIALEQGAPSTGYRRLTVSELTASGSFAYGATSVPCTDTTIAPAGGGVASVDGLHSFSYTGKTATHLTGCSNWISSGSPPASFSAGAKIRLQSIYDGGVPNSFYRAQIVNGSKFNTFYAFPPGVRRLIYISFRCQHPSPLIGEDSISGRSMIWQLKPIPAPFGPIFSMYETEDGIKVTHDASGTGTTIVPNLVFPDKSLWIRMMMDITFSADPTEGRFQLFGDLDESDELVPLSDNLILKTALDAPSDWSNLSIGPYCRMTNAAHWRDYANIQIALPS